MYQIKFKWGITIKVEPYWNVNATLFGTKFENYLIKVEPYWNVNYYEI